MEPGGQVLREDDGAVGTPARAATEHSVGQSERRAAAEQDLLPLVLALGEEAQPEAVGGKERHMAAFSAGDRLGLLAVHRAQVDLRPAPAKGDVGQLPAIGGDGHCGPVVDDLRRREWDCQTYDGPLGQGRGRPEDPQAGPHRQAADDEPEGT